MIRTGMRWVATLALGVFASTALGGPLPENYTLGRYIPADVWLYAHGVHNAERDFLQKEWGEVFEAFKKSGVIEEFKNLLISDVPQEEREQVETAMTTAVDLIKRVRWGDLVRHEVAVGYRMNPPKMEGDVTAGAPADVFPEIIFLCRSATDTLDANVEGLVAIMTQIASLGDAVECAKVDGAEAHWRLSCAGVPLTLNLFRQSNVVGIVMGRRGCQDVMNLMAKEPKGSAIVDAPRFRQALAKVPRPEDSVSYFDIKLLLHDVRGYLKLGYDAAGRTTEKTTPDAPPDRGKRKARMLLRMFGKLIDLADFMDYVIVTEETDGRQTLVHEVAVVQVERKDSPLARLFTPRRPFEKFDTYVPAEATGFHLSTGVDIGLLYKIAVEFIRDDVPDGAEVIAEIEEAMSGAGFDPERDIFSWLSGEHIIVSMPPAVVTPMGGADAVLMIRVKDAEIASQKINAALEKLSTQMAGRGQPLMINPALDVETEGFKTISHPMLAMMAGGLTPVFGFTGDWLVVGTSGPAVDKCLKTAGGDAPSILKNKRFAEEGLIPTGPVVSASFADTSNMAQELAGVAAMMGMMGMFMQGPEMEPARKVLGIVTRLGPVVQKLDFFSSEASMTTHDGLEWKTQRVVTYKDTAGKEKKPPIAE